MFKQSIRIQNPNIDPKDALEKMKDPDLINQELKTVYAHLVPIKNYGLLDLPSFRIWPNVKDFLVTVIPLMAL